MSTFSGKKGLICYSCYSVTVKIMVIPYKYSCVRYKITVTTVITVTLEPLDM